MLKRKLSTAMTGVDSTEERPPDANPSSPSSSSRSSPDTSTLFPLMSNSASSNTSASPPPQILEPLTPAAPCPLPLTPLNEPLSPSTSVIHSPKIPDTNTDSEGSSWSMHLDVLSKLKTESEDWYDNEELSPEALISNSRYIKTEYQSFPPETFTPHYTSPYYLPDPYAYHSHMTPPHIYSPYFPYPHPTQQPPIPVHNSYSPPPPHSHYPLPQTPPTTPHTPPTTPHPPPLHGPPPVQPSSPSQPQIILPKRRGRKPKHVKLEEDNGDLEAVAAAWAEHDAKKRRKSGVTAPPPPPPATPPAPPPEGKPRKKMDRFGGMAEEEVVKRTLVDHLIHGLDMVIIGINPGLFAAYKGHHYAGPGNHFWKCLYMSGLVPEQLCADDDESLLKHSIGFTNIVSRTTRGSADLTRIEIKQGSEVLLSKLRYYRPRIAVFNGKGIYEIFSGKKDFQFGKQPEKLHSTDTYVFVMPSSSARCAQLPRALDKVPFYTALRKFRDFLRGTIDYVSEEEITFAHVKLKNFKKEDKVVVEEVDDDDDGEHGAADQFNGNVPTYREPALPPHPAHYYRPPMGY